MRRLGGLPVAISAGLAFSWSSISTKLLSDALDSGDWTSIIGWAAATAIGGAVGTASEMTALQSRGATEVAPLVFVMQLLVPVLLAPVLVHEAWDSTPLGGLVLVTGLLAVAAGSALLASPRVVAAFTAGAGGPAAPHTAQPGKSPEHAQSPTQPRRPSRLTHSPPHHSTESARDETPTP